MCWERKQKLESWFWMKILLRGALLIWTQIFSHLKSSKKFWSVKNSVFGCNWASTFSYHFKLDYLCCLDEKENGHQLFDFPPIPPSRPGSSPSNGFIMKLWNDDLCGLINFVLIFTWKYWSTVFSHPTSSWLCATRWTFSLDNLTLYDLVLQHYYNYCVIGNIGYPSLHSGQEE